MRCHCGCGKWRAKVELLDMAENVRHHFGGHPLVVTSGYRCRKHNAAVGGVKNSQHRYGRAIDGRIAGIAPARVVQYVLAAGLGWGYVIDAQHFHIDTVKRY